MNGNSRLGILFAIFSGSLVSQGVDGLSENVWSGVLAIVLGLCMTVAAFSQVDKGTRESIRVHDLEKAAKRNR